MCYDAVLPSGSDTWSNCAFWIYFNKIHKEFINMWGKNICIFKLHLYFFLGIYWLFTCPVKSTSSWLQEYSTGSLIILKATPLYPFQRLSCCLRQGSSAPSTAGTARCHSWHGTEGLAAFCYFLKRGSHSHFWIKIVIEKIHGGRSVKLIYNIILCRKAKNIKKKKIKQAPQSCIHTGCNSTKNRLPKNFGNTGD